MSLLRKYTVRMPDLRISDAERDILIAYLDAKTAAHEKAAGDTKAGAKEDNSPHR